MSWRKKNNFHFQLFFGVLNYVLFSELSVDAAPIAALCGFRDVACGALAASMMPRQERSTAHGMADGIFPLLHVRARDE